MRQAAYYPVTGTFIAPADGTGIDNQGTIRPGGAGTAGTLTITGDLTNSSGIIEIEIDNNGAAAGTDFDLLAITGQADLQGRLNATVDWWLYGFQ